MYSEKKTREYVVGTFEKYLQNFVNKILKKKFSEGILRKIDKLFFFHV